MKIYYTTSNNGDGSASVHFFESQECIDLLEEHDPETWGMGEGGSSFNLEGTHDLSIDTLEDVKAMIEEE